MARRAASNVNRSRFVELMRLIKDARRVQDDAKKDVVVWQGEALPMLRALDESGKGIVLESGEAVYYQQNAAPENWDLEKLVPYLREKGMLAAVQTTFVDPKKLESEIEQGNISRSDVKAFTVLGKQPAAFVRFGKPGEDSAQL